MCSGERPIGAAKGKQSDTEALCQPPTPGGDPTSPRRPDSLLKEVVAGLLYFLFYASDT